MTAFEAQDTVGLGLLYQYYTVVGKKSLGKKAPKQVYQIYETLLPMLFAVYCKPMKIDCLEVNHLQEVEQQLHLTNDNEQVSEDSIPRRKTL
jgi:hypothetical protein